MGLVLVIGFACCIKYEVLSDVGVMCAELGFALRLRIALFLTALGALGQGVPLLWQQDTMFRGWL